MSEYQYYEFRALDRPLTSEQMNELGTVSSRAEITPTSFVNTYNYGDFRGNPARLMDQFFDAFVYVANWGSHQWMIRVPRQFLDTDLAATYCDGATLTLRVGAEYAVLDFSCEEMGEDEDGWVEGEPWMLALIGTRAEVMQGDWRALYLGWLASLRSVDWERGDENIEDDETNPLEPPVPPGLTHLSASLRSLAEFLRVDDELIEVAAAGNTSQAPAEPTPAELASWIKRLPVAEKDAYLLRFLTEGSDLLLRAELWKRFREATTAPAAANLAAPDGRRRAAQILAARDALIETKNQKAAQRAAREQVKVQNEKAAARVKHLDDLSRREAASWVEVDQLIATRLPKNYDTAVQLLADLRELARRSGRAAEAEARILKIHQQHRSKPSLMTRFKQHDLGS